MIESLLTFSNMRNTILITFLFSPNSQVMSWRTGHKIACQQMKVSSPVSGSNKSGTASLESHKGHSGLKFCVLLITTFICFSLITKLLVSFRWNIKMTRLIINCSLLIHNNLILNLKKEECDKIFKFVSARKLKTRLTPFQNKT